MKKLFAILLTVIMVLSMTLTAMADGESNGTDTSASTTTTSTASPADGDDDSATLEGRTFAAYQIFAATSISATGELGNITWGDGITADGKTALINLVLTGEEWTAEKKANATALDVAAALTESNAKAFAQVAYDNLNGTGTTVVSGTTTLGIGYYLIVDATTGTLTPNVRNLSILKVSDNATPVVVVSKVSVPEVDKKIVEGENKVAVNEASIGDEVNYEITGTLPSNLSDYEGYYYQFADTLSKGLTYKAGSIKVMAGSKDVTGNFTIVVGEYSETEGTSITITCGNVKDITGVTADTTFVVTYTATLNEHAVIADTGNPNTVKLIYSNNPDVSGKGNPDDGYDDEPKGETPTKTVTTYTTELTITKTDKDGNFLPGVEFELTGNGVKIVLVKQNTFAVSTTGTYYKLKNGTYTTTVPTDATADKYESVDTTYAPTTTLTTKDTTAEGVTAVGTVGEDGTVTFTGLGAGEYTITETVTLAGYNTIAPITFEVSFDAATAKFAATNGINLEDDNTLATTIINKKGLVLPETGGIGTTIFYVVGAVLVIAAGVLLIVKKRMKDNA